MKIIFTKEQFATAAVSSCILSSNLQRVHALKEIMKDNCCNVTFIAMIFMIYAGNVYHDEVPEKIIMMKTVLG